MLASIGSTLESIAEVQSAIAAGESLFLAGSREALSQLPRGCWAGGTIPYFMTEQGGLLSEDRIFVTRVPAIAVGTEVADYGAENLRDLYRDAPVSGVTFLILPAGSAVHEAFAKHAPSFDGFLLRPVVGWVAGVRVDQIGKEAPLVFNGKTGAVFEARAVALHVGLPSNVIADLDIVNIFESGDGDVIRFEESGFRVSDCRINGKATNLARYIGGKGIQTEFPLVGDYNGSTVNVSFQKVDESAGVVDLFAPVFPGVDYRLAKPVEDYEGAFAHSIVASDQQPVFACNCILNYLYGKLEGKKTANITGPITFGEIAHQLLNQTMVRLYLQDID